MAAAKKTATKKPPAKKSAPKPPTPAELEDKVFNDIVKRYTEHRDFDMVEDTFDLYGRLLMDREDEQS